MLYHNAFDNLGARADETIVFDDGRACLQWLQHTAKTHPAGEMNILAHLGAGADRGPGVHHGAAVDISADIDIGRHQNDAGGDVGSPPRRRRRHYPHARGSESLCVPGGVFGGDLVKIAGIAVLDDAVVIQAEG